MSYYRVFFFFFLISVGDPLQGLVALQLNLAVRLNASQV